MYKLEWAKQAAKDSRNIERTGLKKQVAKIHGVVRHDPYEQTPGHNFEKLTNYDPPVYTRRISLLHRFVYTIEKNTTNEKDPQTGVPYDGIIHIIRMWGHFPPK